MLGRVVAHEPSHIYRGHATQSAQAVHGWLEEGDAQRDAWRTLTCLLPDSTWSRVARWGRVAQTRLSREQPPAYQQFGTEEPDLMMPSAHDPPDEPASWIVEPPRRVFRLVRSSAVEIPVEVWPREVRTPIIGDHFFLSDSQMTAGPWALVAKTLAPKLGHPSDLAAVDRKKGAVTGTSQPTPEFQWLYLRPVRPLKATRSHEQVPFAHSLQPSHMSLDDHAMLSSQLTQDAHAVAQKIGDEETTDHQSAIRDDIQFYEAKGMPVPDFLRAPPPDPFDDWH